MYVSVDIIEYIALEEIFMISKISVEDRNLNSVRSIARKNPEVQNPPCLMQYLLPNLYLQ